ncbi:TlpA family protein disulfide reductase [Thermoactinomyces mirandus]|uniref:TlpA family protein disulfide reductase n=1 Tax=Thermoactinomyces mirandus TaxID=2756294 RepID=A0A7W2AR51_9BACL|nr:TlpA disulfide reductase family protein [Thermoactinomyces mirandus]MBA4601191.1 TlpA family protein disulfide reductase [Thermoactinomyces mirandus]
MRKRQIAIVGVLLAAVIGAIFMTVRGARDNPAASMGRVECQGETKPAEGYCAPNFKLPTLSREELELYRNHGKPTVVNFWATWCPPCKYEMPYFQKLYEQYNNEINVIMVNQTAMESKEEDVGSYLKKNRFTFPVVLDRLQDGSVVGIDQYRLFSIPATFIVDENGKIVHQFMGTISEEQLFSAVKEVLH